MSDGRENEEKANKRGVRVRVKVNINWLRLFLLVKKEFLDTFSHDETVR